MNNYFYIQIKEWNIFSSSNWKNWWLILLIGYLIDVKYKKPEFYIGKTEILRVINKKDDFKKVIIWIL